MKETLSIISGTRWVESDRIYYPSCLIDPLDSISQLPAHLHFLPNLKFTNKYQDRHGARDTKRCKPACCRGSRIEAKAEVGQIYIERLDVGSQSFTHTVFRQVVGSRAAALETLHVLRQVVTKARFSNFEQLVEIIRTVGRRLVDAQPKGLYHHLHRLCLRNLTARFV